jgi:hypothetical protein
MTVMNASTDEQVDLDARSDHAAVGGAPAIASDARDLRAAHDGMGISPADFIVETRPAAG